MADEQETPALEAAFSAVADNLEAQMCQVRQERE